MQDDWPGHGSSLSETFSQDASRDNRGHQARRGLTSPAQQSRPDGSPSRRSVVGSMTQKQPARSYFQSSFHSPHTPTSSFRVPSYTVREDTAELASRALFSISHNESSPTPGLPFSPASRRGDSIIANDFGDDSSSSSRLDDRGQSSSGHEPSHTELQDKSRSSSRSGGKSALTEMIRESAGMDRSAPGPVLGKQRVADGLKGVNLGKGNVCRPTERTTLLSQKAAYRSDKSPGYGSAQDLESLKAMKEPLNRGTTDHITQSGPGLYSNEGHLLGLNERNIKTVLTHGFSQTLHFLPSIILGLLLNVLDALSYGMILFPLSQPPFTKLGPDGISMFYVSCIVSQLVYSCGGSIFKGGVGSEMIEVVPFFHKMAYTILNRIGEEHPQRVLATTILSFSLSSIMTGAVFFIMGQCRIGTLIGFFPRHILLGCIGGVGLFLVLTGLEVAGRLKGSFSFNRATIEQLFRPMTLPLWIIPLGLATSLLIGKRWIKHPLTDATYFASIVIVFYFFVLVVPQLSLPDLRSKGWIFEAPEASVPFYHFYTLYNFSEVDWAALGSTIPAMVALTFFGILHVPINIPALGLTIGEDNVDIDRELKAHGISNALSGFCGSIQNYLVYTNTVLFMRSGGDSRLAGVLLALATCGILVIGTTIIGYIPIMVVGALIFFLGIDLMREALFDTLGRVHRLEYITIVIIVITMGLWDFVVGILVGVLLACVSFVLQTSQISAIRGTLFGGVANSTVRRHPIQQRFLQDAGKQIHVMKMAGYLFFGTIVGVEKKIRTLLDEVFQIQPIRFLILDLFNVDGVDFSAAEAFNRINRILNAKDVQLVVCGLDMDGDLASSLRNVGLFDDSDSVQNFLSLNSALEYCENELLKAFYHERALVQSHQSSAGFLEVPHAEQTQSLYPEHAVYSSPRQNHLRQVATTALSEQHPAPPDSWENYEQPLQLILQTFCTVSDQPESFWVPTARFFERRAFPAGAVLYRAGEAAQAFFLLECGMLKARYELPQGSYSEVIVAGTTCGELPFFSSTPRTSTTQAERDCVTWRLTRDNWIGLQKTHAAVAQELLTISLKLTSERMDAITKYMLLTSG